MGCEKLLVDDKVLWIEILVGDDDDYFLGLENDPKHKYQFMFHDGAIVS